MVVSLLFALSRIPLLEELLWAINQARAPALRSLRQFAEQEIIIPDGRYKGRRFTCERQPYTGLVFDAIDSGNWRRFAFTGPTQSGKSLCAYVIIIMYHLFELKESVVAGIPDLNMVADKWRDDILPAIMASRYADQLPSKGRGSRRGESAVSITFRNGATLRWMTGGSGEAGRAAYTARVVVITEADKMDTTSEASRQANPISQLEGRTQAFGDQALLYEECTVTIEQGWIWKEIKGGTNSRIMIRCPYCRNYVKPEREHLIGWQDAEDEFQAVELGHFICPECGVGWTDADREKANIEAVLLHGEQTVDIEGVISGDLPRTYTLGIRWSAANNLFVPASEIALKEWKGQRDPDPDNAERELRQQWWAIPDLPSSIELIPLDAEALVRRVEDQWPRGRVPDWTEVLTAGVDVHKTSRGIVWDTIAWTLDGSKVAVVDYGVEDVEQGVSRLGAERAIMAALHEVRSLCLAGWVGADGRPRIPDQVWIDHGYAGEVVDAFCMEVRENGKHRFRPCIGRGAMQQRTTAYAAPKKGKGIQQIGQGYHFALRPRQVPLVVANADEWKTFVHERLRTQQGQPGALTLFKATPREHSRFIKQLTAEHSELRHHKADGREVLVWIRDVRENHFLDCTWQASAAAHKCGVRVVGKSPEPAKPVDLKEYYAGTGR
jgi:phage terminase large subunit GpA-like protein